jgi:hypothetical protein
VDEDCLIGAVAETFDLVAVIQACSTYLLRLTLPFVAFVPQFFLPIWQCSFLASSHRFATQAALRTVSKCGLCDSCCLENLSVACPQLIYKHVESGVRDRTTSFILHAAYNRSGSNYWAQLRNQQLIQCN